DVVGPVSPKATAQRGRRPHRSCPPAGRAALYWSHPYAVIRARPPSLRGLPVQLLERDGLRLPPRDVLRDLPRVEPPVLDEPAVGLQPAADRARQVQAGPRALEGDLVEHGGSPAIVGERDAQTLEEREVGLVARQRQDEVVRDLPRAVRRLH